ncbi:LytS/YhcK type 5TM receptor domain-containing protein, partial [Aneurinibacillus tyrosinisolvens]|uniref:LytS/YhcK type 5TM receptor domain-containing protein n=1 Tax=Aneurinibacillus tyrosinisolvens TaxID=1443435 RepID=UPI000AA0DA55
MFGVKDFLLNMLFIILVIFAYQIFWADKIKGMEKKEKEQNKYIIIVLCGIAIILCMTFPVLYAAGYNYDLRKIPLLIGIFYGGYTAGIFLTVVIIVYRFFLGGDGVINTIVIYPVLTCIAFAFLPRFKRYTLKQKFFLPSILACSISFFPEALAKLLGIVPFAGEPI